MLSNRAYLHIRSNAIAYAALFFAITGSATALTKIHGAAVKNKNIKTGAVDTRTIKDHTVRGKDLHRNSVGSGAVAFGALRGSDLASNTVTGAQIDEPSLDPDVLQFRIKGDCPPGDAIRSVGPDGQVICESTTGNVTVNGVTDITTSGGLTGGGGSGTVALGVDPTVLQNRVSGICIGDNAVKSVNQDGSVSCQPVSTGGGTVTSVDSGFGLTGGPITSAGALSIDPGVTQQRVNGFCIGNNALRQIGQDGAAGCTHFVVRVNAGTGLLGGTISNTGAISADTSYLQRRVRQSCTGDEAIQAVDEDGNVVCSGDFQSAGHVLVPPMVRIDPGAAAPLLNANGIKLVGTCTDTPSAEVRVFGIGGQVVAFGHSQSLGFVKATTSALLASSANGDRGDFNSFRETGGGTLDGSFMSFVAGGKCVFEASAIAS